MQKVDATVVVGSEPRGECHAADPDSNFRRDDRRSLTLTGVRTVLDGHATGGAAGTDGHPADSRAGSSERHSPSAAVVQAALDVGRRAQ